MKKRLALKILASPPTQYSWTLRKQAYKLEPRLKDKLLAKARRRLRDLQTPVKSIIWQWCGLCRGAYINCPECGNNTCNGGSYCGMCYKYEALALAFRGGQRPEMEEVPGAAEKQEDFDNQMMRNAFEGL